MADRFARHRVLIGDAGQQRIRQARVLVVGLGGLGAPAAMYLAAAGIGRLTLVDFADVDAPDLQRQILYGASDIGRKKADVAAERLRIQHPDVEFTARATTFDALWVAGHDVVLDGTDEPGSRALVHAACVGAGVPLVWGTVEAWDGQLTTVVPGGPCIDCLFPEAREVRTCADVGVLGPLAGQVGCMMAAEALRVVIGRPAAAGHLLVVDGRDGTTSAVDFPRRDDCPTCSGAAK